MNTKLKHSILLFTIFGFLVVCSAIIYMILQQNDGMFIFTLDDPYIHLAVAENIARGHYGINLEEFSAPSSSIVWPYFISALTFLTNELLIAYALLAINIIFALATIYVFWLCITICINTSNNNSSISTLLIGFALLIFITANTNLIGLAFTGMEHSLQVFLCALIAYGCIRTISNNSLSWWLVFSIILAPLVRYDTVAVALPAAAFLFMIGYYYKSTIALAIAATSIVLFGLYLTSKGLGFFPSSILVKSDVVNSSDQGSIMSALISLFKTLDDNIIKRQALLLVFIMTVLALHFFRRKIDFKARMLSGAFLGAGLLHIIAGQFDWFDRYEIYILAPSLLIAIFLYKETIFGAAQHIHPALYILVILVITPFFGFKYIKNNLFIPFASNNIYSQQYQTHRFITEYYKKPVAVNDLGYPAFQNDNYVLDLWGLGSYEALQLRKNETNTLWMGDLVDKKNIKLIAIYDDWFTTTPPTWAKIASMQLTSKKVTAASDTVSFYVTNCQTHQNIKPMFNDFFTTTPANIAFEIFECKPTSNPEES